MGDAYYHQLDEQRFLATGNTSGPWSPDAQHFGPVSALMVRALERCAPRPDTSLSRVVLEVLSPVPVGEVEVVATLRRPGRSVELLTAELTAGGRAVATANAWRIVRNDTAAIAAGSGPALPPPESAGPMMIPPGWDSGHLHSTEWRSLRGGIAEPGGATVWARQRPELVLGEEPTGLQRLFVLADSASGVSSRLDVTRWMFINVDLSVHLYRQPVGEWIGMDAETTIGPDGTGITHSVLHDVTGPVGRGAQSLLIRPR